MKRKFLPVLVTLMSLFTLASCGEKLEWGEAPETESRFPHMTLEGKVGDDLKANMVYVDLSEGVQHKVARKSWHIGLYCKDLNRITLNQSLSRAYSTKKTDFSAVSIQDTTGFPNLSAGMMSFLDLQGIQIVDDVDRDLEKTLFGEIATDLSKSEVYLLATEELEDRNDWFKVQFTTDSKSYTIRYGKINDKEPQIAVVKKDPSLTFIGFSLDTGKEVALPQKWDLMWSGAMAWSQLKMLIFGPASDVVATNRYHHTETAEVMVAEVCGFEEFEKSHLSKITFKKEGDVMGTRWRTAPMPNTTPGPNMDRFYVIKDEDGMYFKIRFTHFCEADGGVRGLPTLEYVEIK